MKIKLITLEKERDQLKWNEEKQSLLNEINKYQDLIKSKDTEYQHKVQHDHQRLKDEVQSIEEDYKDQLQTLQAAIADKDKQFRQLNIRHHE